MKILFAVAFWPNHCKSGTPSGNKLFTLCFFRNFFKNFRNPIKFFICAIFLKEFYCLSTIFRKIFNSCFPIIFNPLIIFIFCYTELCSLFHCCKFHFLCLLLTTELWSASGKFNTFYFYFQFNHFLFCVFIYALRISSRS